MNSIVFHRKIYYLISTGIVSAILVLAEIFFDGRTHLLGYSALILWIASVLLISILWIKPNHFRSPKKLIPASIFLLAGISLYFLLPYWINSWKQIGPLQLAMPRINSIFIQIAYAIAFLFLFSKLLTIFDVLLEPLKVTIAKNIFFVLLSIFIVFYLGEAAFILSNNFGINSWEIYDSDNSKNPFIYKGHFGNKHEFTNIVTLNNYQFWDNNWEITKHPNFKRIIVIGDSFVEGRQVALANTVHKKLQSILLKEGKNVDVLGMGASGYGTIDEEKKLFSLAMSFRPDLIIICFLPSNDVRNSSDSLQSKAVQEDAYWLNNNQIYYLAHFYRLNFLGWILFKIDRIGAQLRHTGKPPIDTYVYTSVPIDKEWENGWQNIQDSLERMQRLSTSNGIKFALVSISSPEQIGAFANDKEINSYLLKLPKLSNAEWDFTGPDNRIESFCITHKIPVLILSKYFSIFPKTDRSRIHFYSDRHWSDYGHDSGAKAIAEFINHEGLVN